MDAKKKYIIVLITLAILLAVGLWNIQNGKIAFGTSLIGASIGVGIMRYKKGKTHSKAKSQRVKSP